MTKPSSLSLLPFVPQQLDSCVKEPQKIGEQTCGHWVLKVFHDLDGSIYGSTTDTRSGLERSRVKVKGVEPNLDKDHVANAIALLKAGILMTDDGESINFIQRGLVGGGSSQSSLGLKNAKDWMSKAKSNYTLAIATKNNDLMSDAVAYTGYALDSYKEVYGDDKNKLPIAEAKKLRCMAFFAQNKDDWAVRTGKEAQQIYIALNGKPDSELAELLKDFE